MFSCKRWTSTNFVRWELTIETLASPKHGKIILKVHVPNKKKHDSLASSRSGLWMVRRWHGISRIHCYYFCLEPTVRKGTWMRATFITIVVYFSESGILKVTWSQLCSKSLLNKYEIHWQQHFERYPTVLYLTDIDQHAC